MLSRMAKFFTCPKMGMKRRIRRTAQPVSQRGKRGATAVEMALIAPTFFLLLIGITESCLMLTAQQIMENAAFNASRLAKTGYVTAGSTQLATVSTVMNNELKGYGTFFDLTKVTFTYTTYNSCGSIPGSPGTVGMGTASQLVVYTISYPWTMFTPMLGALIGTFDNTSGHYIFNLSTRIVVRNEPYS